MWGVYLGRPFHIHLDDLTLERPPADCPSTEDADWAAYDSCGSIAQDPPLRACDSMISNRLIALFEIMSNLGHIM
jgi:hypothetical protein